MLILPGKRGASYYDCPGAPSDSFSLVWTAICNPPSLWIYSSYIRHNLSCSGPTVAIINEATTCTYVLFYPGFVLIFLLEGTVSLKSFLLILSPSNIPVLFSTKKHGPQMCWSYASYVHYRLQKRLQRKSGSHRGFQLVPPSIEDSTFLPYLMLQLRPCSHSHGGSYFFAVPAVCMTLFSHIGIRWLRPHS